jgi:hypothetical protein
MRAWPALEERTVVRRAGAEGTLNMADDKKKAASLEDDAIVTSRVGRRSALLTIGASFAGALAVASSGCGGGASNATVESGMTDSDPTDSAGAGVGTGTDSDPTDSAGQGRPAVTDSDPTDSAGAGNTGLTDSDSSDEAGHGRGGGKPGTRGRRR